MFKMSTVTNYGYGVYLSIDLDLPGVYEAGENNSPISY